MPNAVFTTRIIFRIVRRGDRSHGRGDLVFTTAFLAIVTVLVKRETVVARTLVRAYRVLTLVLTTSIVIGTLVHIREKYSSEA